MSKSAKPLYTAHVSVWAPSLNRGRMVESYETVVEGTNGEKRVVTRQRLGKPLDGGVGRGRRGARRISSPGLYVHTGGIAFEGQGLEIKDRQPAKDDDRHARAWTA